MRIIILTPSIIIINIYLTQDYVSLITYRAVLTIQFWEVSISFLDSSMTVSHRDVEDKMR